MTKTKRYKLNFTLADGSTKSIECDIPIENVTSLIVTSPTNTTATILTDDIKLGTGFHYNPSDEYGNFSSPNASAICFKADEALCTG